MSEDNEEDTHPSNDQYRDAATRMYAVGDDVEIDADAEVSVGDDGAFVQAWVYVPDHEAAAEQKGKS